jgi:hypothetical protein
MKKNKNQHFNKARQICIRAIGNEPRFLVEIIRIQSITEIVLN